MNPVTPADAAEALDRLAESLIDSEADLPSIHADLKLLLAPEVASALADRLELCPTHSCDYRICLDDRRSDCEPASGL